MHLLKAYNEYIRGVNPSQRASSATAPPQPLLFRTYVWFGSHYVNHGKPEYQVHGYPQPVY